MQIFSVGGAVRDELLGLPVQDRDYVVVGASPREMLARGFRQVGKDFPVFLHPQSHEEYALARTERKTGPGYRGFSVDAAPTVTLAEDLARRDLTINAIARDVDGELIDPHHGIDDLQARVLRHVGPAFREDPVRILRLARFAARFPDFRVAPETVGLLREMVAAGEVDHLVSERVWQELAKGLLEDRPSRMFEVLRQCGALARLLPELDALFGVPQRADCHPEVDTGVHVMLVVDQSAQRRCSLPVRWAVLLHDLGKGLTPAADLPRHPGHEARSVELAGQLCARLRVPAACRELAVLVARHHGEVHRAPQLTPAAVVRLLEGSDALRRPDRFEQLLEACICDFHGRLGWLEVPYPAPALLRRALAAVRSVDAAAIAAGCSEPALIAARLSGARVAAVEELLSGDLGAA
ncbi:MAG TPA: multifunctional CCA addition/repair protein [Candidatus Accumulibacter phosphatis]|nr:MAG: Multifunctional CCA protein [Candidatus Accumulibacter sp. SK-11]HAY28753.1 multifunctional CCA addition/repair protein [Accumulibacter sp.]HRL74866.1 multifunctional CCA addition/repair protein [Candidatus Accumulibacter phosphatis]HCN68922.1 multifunctional CCA addition/repair protein [Accumulibacter sp.]HCV12914.1 multifunctional CCA addition/repair protein [Accumulibacter sp.]